MFCPNCGTSVRDGAAFCPACGTAISIQAGGGQAAPQVQNQGDYANYGDQTYANQGYDQPYANQGYSDQGYANQGYDQSYAQTNDYYDNQQPASVGGGAIRNDRNIVVYVLLTIVTCGIYGYWYIYQLAQDANTMCAEDGEETPGLLIYILLSMVSCGFYAIYWEYKLANRLSAYAPRYGAYIKESGNDVLMWHLIGMLICGLGTFVGTNILFNITNSLANAYNSYYGYTYTMN